MNIDEMLSQPLPTVADNGFSARVTKKIRAAEYRRLALGALLATLATAVFCLLVPIDFVMVELNVALVQVGTSGAVGLAAAVLVLLYLWDNRYLRFE